jgi:hypothetical protein
MLTIQENKSNCIKLKNYGQFNHEIITFNLFLNGAFIDR